MGAYVLDADKLQVVRRSILLIRDRCAWQQAEGGNGATATGLSKGIERGSKVGGIFLNF